MWCELNQKTKKHKLERERQRETEREMASGSFVKIPDIKFTKLFINGNFVDSISGKTFGTIDPRTGEQIARIAEGDKEDVNLAVKAARVAFDHGPWPRLSGSAIRRIMMKYADLINENTEELVALDTIDAGKLFGRGKAVDIPAAAETLRYYAGAADKIHGETLKMSQELQADTLHEPVGVVGHIIPWNFPSIMFSTKVAPALAARCTMIVKPAEQTPLSALHNAHLAKLYFGVENSKKGELVTCSKHINSDLFYAVLGGLGQFGIIT
ncbi:hypothetical protein CsSME_00023016 [Camellia sinensis var. sinensis]